MIKPNTENTEGGERKRVPTGQNIHLRPEIGNKATRRAEKVSQAGHETSEAKRRRKRLAVANVKLWGEKKKVLRENLAARTQRGGNVFPPL